jgi:Protein of unknown function (DUF3037)
VSARIVFEYALLRVVPSIERGECMNVGVVLLCRQRRFLSARLHVDAARLRALSPDVDIESIQQQLDHIPVVCAGGAAAGPLGELPVQERFRWLTAPRSTILQCSAVHCGLTLDPARELERLHATLVV